MDKRQGVYRPHDRDKDGEREEAVGHDPVNPVRSRHFSGGLLPVSYTHLEGRRQGSSPLSLLQEELSANKTGGGVNQGEHIRQSDGHYKDMPRREGAGQCQL